MEIEENARATANAKKPVKIAEQFKHGAAVALFLPPVLQKKKKSHSSSLNNGVVMRGEL